MVKKLADTEVRGGGGQNLKTKLCLNRSEIYIFLSKDSNSRLSAQKTKNIVLCQNRTLPASIHNLIPQSKSPL